MADGVSGKGWGEERRGCSHIEAVSLQRTMLHGDRHVIAANRCQGRRDTGEREKQSERVKQTNKDNDARLKDSVTVIDQLFGGDAERVLDVVQLALAHAAKRKGHIASETRQGKERKAQRRVREDARQGVARRKAHGDRVIDGQEAQLVRGARV